MNDNLRRAGLTLLIMAVVVLSIALARKEPIVKLIPVVDPNYVQNPYEAQERLKAQGLYDGKIDGIWGKETDRAYCDWCAIREMKRMEKSR